MMASQQWLGEEGVEEKVAGQQAAGEEAAGEEEGVQLRGANLRRGVEVAGGRGGEPGWRREAAGGQPGEEALLRGRSPAAPCTGGG